MAAAHRPSSPPLVRRRADLDRRVSKWRVMPAWIISAMTHVVLLFFFFHVTLPGSVDGANFFISPVVTEVDGERLPDENLLETVPGLDVRLAPGSELERPDEAAVPGLPVDPLGEPGLTMTPDSPLSPLNLTPGAARGQLELKGIGIESGIGAPGGIIGAPLVRRASASAKKAALDLGGGNKHSEAAVALGLEWLALHQAQDGRWSLHEFHRHARKKPLPAGGNFIDNGTGQAARQNDIAATAFGLLPFLAAGVTHKPGTSDQSKAYAKAVEGGLKFLASKQGKDGYFGGDMYSHGLASIAMCEAFGMTSDPTLKRSAQSALNFIVQAQDPAGGGWRYSPRTPGDMSVTGWQLMALKCGQMSGLSVPAACLKKAEQFIDACQSKDKGGCSYIPGSPETPSMTAVGLLCRQYMGISPRNPGLLAGVERLRKVPPGGSGNLYYDYYATQVMFHMGGQSWNFWNLGPAAAGKDGIRDTLIRKQDQGSDPNRSSQRGSWGPAGTGFDKEGGRIMATSLSLLTLEIYYRHLPLYRRDLGVVKEEK